MTQAIVTRITDRGFSLTGIFKGTFSIRLPARFAV
jgi:hypothetical protein